MATIPLQAAEGLRVTILMDNVTDPLLPDEGPVRRRTWPKALAPGQPRVPTRAVPGEGVPDALVAEPGFSALVEVEAAGRRRTLLFDTGVSPNGMVENARRLGLDLRDVEAIVLSHGHWDHVAGMEGVARVLGPSRLPVVIHPEGWTRRRLAFPGLAPAELPTPSRADLRGAGFEIVEGRQPSLLVDERLLITGEVDRTTPFERGFPGHEAFRDGAWGPDPMIRDDQALVARVARGLVVLSGCGHAGIVNTVRHAQRLTGEDRIAAVIGGFHLSGPVFEPVIEPTVSALGALAPGLLAPAHCTGWRAVHALAGRFPDAFVQCAVGTAIEL